LQLFTSGLIVFHMEAFFPLDAYFTPDGIRRSLVDRLCLGTRWGFYSKYVKIIFKYRPFAVRGTYDDEKWARSSVDVHQAIESSGGRIQIEGLDNIREEPGPLVFVSNHMSTAETQLLPGIIEPIKRFTFVVKESLMKGPVWGPVMRSRKPIAITQKDPRKDIETVLNEGTRILSEGRSVFLFPEGERSMRFQPQNFNSLGIKLAKKANVKILPVALKTDFWGNGLIFPPFGPIRRKQKIHFKFGRARELEGSGKKQHQEIIEWIIEHLGKWGLR